MSTKQKQKMAEKAKKRESVFSKIKLGGKKEPPKETAPAKSDNIPHKANLVIKDLPAHTVEHEVAKIKALLEQMEFIQIYSDALKPNGTPKAIEELLYSNETFKEFASYHNHNIAHYYAADIAGLGPLQQLLDEAKKPGHERITDIGFNSNNKLTVETNKRKFIYGNKPRQPVIDRKVIDGIISLLTQQGAENGRAFSKAFPLYNGANEANYLRISATHSSVSTYGATLSIRVSYPGVAITEKNFNEMAPMNKDLNVLYLLAVLVKCHANIMISAETGAGKTELQKMLIKYIPNDQRIILIEDTAEMHLPELYKEKDIFAWLSGKEKGRNTITDLLIHSLRNNPIWIIIAETRGAEAFEMFQSVKTDHSIITTLHAPSNADVPGRFAGMIQTGYSNLETDLLERDFRQFMDIGIHLTKRIFHGRVVRYIDDIAEFVPISKEHPDGVNTLFHQHIDQAGFRTYWTQAPTKKLQQKIIEQRDVPISKKEWHVTGEDHKKQELIDKDLNADYHKRLTARKKREQEKG